MQILLATTNFGKIKYYKSRLENIGVEVLTLKDLKIEIEVNENGTSPEENAIIKAKSYSKFTNIPTLALDDGLYFENIPNYLQPGVHVRRVKGKYLNDEEMVDYYVDLIKKYGLNNKLNGYFLKGIAIVHNGNIYSYTYQSKRFFVSKISKTIIKGMPLASLQYFEKYHKYKSELSESEENEIMVNEQTAIFDFINSVLNKIE